MQPAAVSATLSPWEPGLLSLTLYAVMVVLLILILLLLTRWIGERKENHEKSRPYECGVIPSGSARFPFPIPFYLVAAFFLVFDVEAIYIFAWAIAFEQLGWTGWLQISFFIIVLLVGLLYVWKKGELDWKTSP